MSTQTEPALPGDLHIFLGSKIHEDACAYAKTRTLDRGEPLWVYHGMVAAYLRGAKRGTEFNPDYQTALSALERLKSFQVEDKPMHFNKKNIYYEPGDEKAPFVTEGFLYPLLGKEDARTLLALFRKLEDAIKEGNR